MIIAERGRLINVLKWQWRGVVMAALAATVVTVAHEVFGQTWFLLPALPLTVVGAALGIFCSFRTNSCYDRWWEGRKLWGRLINTSRHWAIQARRYVPEPGRRLLIRRQIAYVHTLRALLRDEDPLVDENVLAYLSDEEVEALRASTNHTARLLDMQMHDVLALNGEGVVDEFRLQSLDESVRHLLDIQGGCERIKKTPLPRGYGFIADIMITGFGYLLPMGIAKELSWATIPVSVLAVLCFKLISETGRVLENPFSTFWNGLPLSAMSRTIERNLLEILGEKELPPPVQPSPPGVLM